MFVVAVLAVIGIGVGVVGGLAYPKMPSRTYGRPPYAFSAEFPLALGGKLVINCVGGTAPDCEGKPVSVGWGASTYEYEAFVLWIRRDTPVGVKLAKSLLPPPVYRSHSVTRQGVTYLEATPTCRGNAYGFLAGMCSDLLVETSGDITWIVGAGSRADWPMLPEAFLNSFKPTTP